MTCNRNDSMLVPDVSEAALAESRACFFRGGEITDRRLSGYCKRLTERFRLFASTCPAPCWAPGLRLTHEMHLQYELFLPMEDILPALTYLCRRASLNESIPLGAPLFAAQSWPDFLQRIWPFSSTVNPAGLLRKSAVCEKYRFGLLAALSIPKSYGGAFGRYPLQLAFLRRWLSENRCRLAGTVTVLDAACGCGEGSYEVAEILCELGFSKGASRICGVTLEPLELFAAAHGSFPNDAMRAKGFVERVCPILNRGGGEMLRFFRADILNPGSIDGEFDVILCNGFLGGPLLHQKESLSAAMGALVAKLRVGGLLLTADHFHEGWRKKTQGEIVSLLKGYGLEIVEAGEGVSGVRRAPVTRPRTVLRRIP